MHKKEFKTLSKGILHKLTALLLALMLCLLAAVPMASAAQTEVTDYMGYSMLGGGNDPLEIAVESDGEIGVGARYGSFHMNQWYNNGFVVAYQDGEETITVGSEYFMDCDRAFIADSNVLDADARTITTTFYDAEDPEDAALKLVQVVSYTAGEWAYTKTYTLTNVGDTAISAPQFVSGGDTTAWGLDSGYCFLNAPGDVSVSPTQSRDGEIRLKLLSGSGYAGSYNAGRTWAKTYFTPGVNDFAAEGFVDAGLYVGSQFSEASFAPAAVWTTSIEEIYVPPVFSISNLFEKDGNYTAVPGGSYTYPVTLYNSSAAPLTDVILTLDGDKGFVPSVKLPLPAGMAVYEDNAYSITVPANGSLSFDLILTLSDDALPPNQEYSFTLTASYLDGEADARTKVLDCSMRTSAVYGQVKAINHFAATADGVTFDAVLENLYGAEEGDIVAVLYDLESDSTLGSAVIPVTTPPSQTFSVSLPASDALDLTKTYYIQILSPDFDLVPYVFSFTGQSTRPLLSATGTGINSANYYDLSTPDAGPVTLTIAVPGGYTPVDGGWFLLSHPNNSTALLFPVTDGVAGSVGNIFLEHTGPAQFTPDAVGKYIMMGFAELDLGEEYPTGFNAYVSITVVDKGALRTAIDAAPADSDEGLYTPDTWSAMQSALTAAKAVRDQNDAEQSAIDAAATALNSALTALRIDVNNSAVTVDAIPTQPYTGNQIMPSVVVKVNGSVLPAENYTLSYGANTEPGIGTVTITGAGQYTGSRTVSFTIARTSGDITGITLAKEANMYVGQTIALTPRVLAPEGVEYDFLEYTWTSSNPEVASVGNRPSLTGKITGHRAGVAVITARLGDFTASCTVRVSNSVTLRIGYQSAVHNGALTTIDDRGSKPFFMGGRSMVPLRFVSEKMGAKVTYRGDDKPISIKYRDTTIELILKTKTMRVIKGSTVKNLQLEVAAQKQGGRTYCPLRAIGKELGFHIYFQNGTRLIVVNTPEMTKTMIADRLQSGIQLIK